MENNQSTIVKQTVAQINKPMGISEYKLTQSLPEALLNSLPSVAELEQLGGEHE